MWPSGLICGLTVFIAQSRSCLIVTSIIALPVLWAMYKKHLVLFGLIVAGFVAAFLPYSDSISKAPDAVMSYIMRGQSAEDAYTVSGRTEVWDIAVKAFWEAPLFGHGYYSMTSTGTMYVWGAERWQTAHNTYLHVLTGTGVMGYALLIWALLYILQPAWIYVRRPGPERKLAVFILLLVAWYMCLGCFELSFAGPVDPEVVLFFIVLGLSAGLGAHARTRLT
jgi:O-antigen ligase